MYVFKLPSAVHSHHNKTHWENKRNPEKCCCVCPVLVGIDYKQHLKTIMVFSTYEIKSTMTFIIGDFTHLEK